MKSKKFVALEGHFQEIEDYNSTFKRVKIKVFAFDKNANNSDITRTAFSSAQPTIFNIPVIAKYNSEKDDLEGHNAYLTKDKDDNYVIKMDTSPIGVVSGEANISFEDIDEGNGNIKTYIVVDNVFLWKRYEATQKIEEWLLAGIEPKVSMEIGNVDGQFSDGVFTINTFEFEAITALGSDVEPCFPMAQIEEYSKKTFQDAYFEMVKELKFTLQNQPSLVDVDDINTPINKFEKEEKLKLDEKLEILTKYNLTPESISFSIEELSIEEIEVKAKEQFELLASQKQEEIANALRVEKYNDRWGDTESKYSYVDNSDSEVFAYDRENNYNLFGFNYSVSGDAVTIDFESKKRKKFEIVDFIEGTQSLFELFPQEAIDYAISDKEKELTAQFTTEKEKAVGEVQILLDTITTEYELVKPEIVRLQEFEVVTLSELRTEQETEMFSQYEEKLTGVEEFEALKTNSANFTLENLEKELALLFVKKTANFSVNKVKKDTVKINVSHEDDVDNEPYGGLFSKFLDK